MNETPDWLTAGRTVLIMKDKEKTDDLTNFRPIICLPLMWNIFTGILNHLLLPSIKVRNYCQRNKMGDKENRGGQKTNC